MLKEQAERLLSAACDFQGLSMKAREKCRETFRRAESNEHNILRILIDGQIGPFAEDVRRKVEAVTPAVSYQIGVSASFIRTHFLVGDLILNSDLVEAIVLIRKQLESLAKLRQLDSKPFQKLSGKGRSALVNPASERRSRRPTRASRRRRRGTAYRSSGSPLGRSPLANASGTAPPATAPGNACGPATS
jgi:hypothetical protein